MSAADRLSRRQVLTGATLAAGGLALGRPLTTSARRTAPPFEHVVVVMMENRSFDHFLGWLPHADGKQAGLAFPDRDGVLRPTHPLAPDFQGCGYADPDHSYAGGRVEYDDGRCDGWLRAGSNDELAIGYYTQKDLPFLGQAVPQWTTFSRYFAAILSETYPNRIYQHAGQTDRLTNTLALCELPTIWDRLADAGLTGRYYWSDIPFLALWGVKHLAISEPYPMFLADCAAGTLPNVSFIDPRFLGEDQGSSGDDHPHADVRGGEAFMNEIYQAVTKSPGWDRTVLLFNFDEWGGFFDHVPPPAAPIPPATLAAGDTDGRRGFRVPALIVSPYARRGYVAGDVFDHTSVLKMIESRWGLPPLTVRDAKANDLGSVLNATASSAAPPQFDVPQGPFGAPCAPALGTASASTTTSGSSEQEWGGLLSLARASGWPV